MGRQPTWTLLISWMAACTVVNLAMETKVHALVKMDQASTRGPVMNGTPIAKVHESSSPASLALIHADPQDRSITTDTKNTQIGLRSVGWAGIGDIPNNLKQPSSLSLPKWVPDYQPVKEKHWDAIIQGLNDANQQHSKSQDYYEPETVTPATLTSHLPSVSYNEWLPTTNSTLEILLYSTAHHTKPVATETKPMEDFTKRYDSDYNTPSIHIKKAFSERSHDGLLAPTFLNPLEVYLPDHVRYPSQHTNQQEENQHQKIIEAHHNDSHHRRSSNTPNTSKPRQRKYIPWPNVGQVTTLDHTSDVKSVTIPQSQESPISTNLHEKKLRQEIPLMNSEVFPPSQISNAQIGSLLKNTASKFSLPIMAVRDSKIKQITNSPKQSPEVQYDQGAINQKDLQHEEATNQKALLPWEAMVPLPENQDFREKQETKVYTQPWLHAIVQNDLKNWGFPYDKEALQDLPSGYHYSPLPSPREQHKDTDDFYTYLSDEINNQKHNNMPLSPTVNAHHLAIVEAPHKPSNMPLPIRNVHVIAPIPDNIPPIPIFRPAETKSIEFSPYVVNGALSRTPSQNGDNPVLVIPHPARELDPHDRTSNLYPVTVPLKQASQRQDINPIQMIMQPIRDIFRLRNPSNNSRQKKPQHPRQIAHQQHFVPLKQLTPPPEATKKPETQSELVIHIEFPGFGPPKGEDVVTMPDESEHQRDEEDLSNTEPQEVLQEPVKLQATKSPFPSQQFNHQNASKKKPSSEESQAQFIASTVPQSQSFNLGRPENQETTAAATPNTPLKVFQHSLQNPSTNFQPHKKVQQFQQENTQPSQDIFEQFHTAQFTNNKVLPPVVNTETIIQPKDPPNPVFIPWPNIQRASTATPLATNDTSSVEEPLPQTQAPSQQSIPFFNRPSTIGPFRLPSLPGMDFLNPFNLFRSRENTQGKNNAFPFLPSHFSTADNEPSASMTAATFENPPSWPNTKTQVSKYPQQSNSASNFEPKNNSNISFLMDIESSTEKNNATFNFMPHLDPIFKDGDTKLAFKNNPTSIHHNSHLSNSYISKPLIQPPFSGYNTPTVQHLANTQQPSAIHYINQNYPNNQSLLNQYPLPSSMDKTHHSQYTHLADTRKMPHYALQKESQHSFDSFQKSKVINSSRINLKNSHLDNIYHIPRAFAHPSYSAAPRTRVAIINPQTNPARPASSEPQLNKNDNLGPDLIKFTIDDVINVPYSDIHADQIPKISHTSNTRTASQKLTVEEDMDVSPSEEVVKVAEFVLQPQHNKSNVLMMHRITPNPTTTIIPLSTEITKLPNVLQKASTTMSDLNTPPQLIFTPHMQSTNQPDIQLNTSTLASHNFQQKTHSSNLGLNSTTTYRPTINYTINKTNRPSFFPMHWGITQPPDVQLNNTVGDKTKNTRSGNLPSAASTRVTIIEATPMPKAGEIFPTLKHFSMFTSNLPSLTTINPTTVTTTLPSTTTPITPKAKRFDTGSVKQMQTISPSPKIRTATRPLPPNLMKVRKRPEIMMPGSWNHRTISKPPQIESDSFIKNINESSNTEHIITHNQFMVRYIAPPRKVHMNRPTPKPNVSTQKTSNISATLSTNVSNGRLQNSPFVFNSPAQINITEELPTTTSRNTSLETRTVVFRRHPTANIQSKSQGSEKEDDDGVEETLTTTPQYLETKTETTSSKPEADGPSPVGKTARYNSMQRLRNFMANKRRNRTRTTPKAIVLPTESTLSMSVQTKTLKTNISSSAQPTTSSPTRLNLKTFSSFRTHLANRKTTPLTIKTTTAPITTTTTEPLLVIEATTPRSTKESNFMNTDREHNGSGSSTHEWHHPIQEVLHDRPEMLEFYKWESSRLDATKNSNDTNYLPKDQESSHEGSEILLSGASNLPPMTVQPFRQATRVPASYKSSRLEASASSPVVLSPQDTSAARSTSGKVRELTSSGHIKDAWTSLMSGSRRESPQPHPLLPNINDPKEF